MDIVIVGLGYVGLVNLAVLSTFNNNVIGFDINKDKIDSLRHSKHVIEEPYLNEAIKENSPFIKYTTKASDAIRNQSLFFICVDTPENKDGSPNLDNINTVVDGIIKYSTCDGVVVIRSTVPVGTNKQIEEKLNKEGSYHYDVISYPEFLSQGNAVNNEVNPDRLIFGGKKEIITKVLGPIIKIYTDRKIPVLYTSLENAELIKYASNNFLAMKISYINNIARLCDKVGGNIDDVVKGMTLDHRIGDSMTHAGLGYGGSCFPKDTKGFYWTSSQNEEPIELVKATIDTNKQQIEYFINKIFDRVKRFANRPVAVLGLAFKGGTGDLRNSPAIEVCNALLNKGAILRVYDPLVKEEQLKTYYSKRSMINLVKDVDSALENAEFAVILNDSPIFKDLTKDDFSLLKNRLVFDGKNLFKKSDLKGIEYISIGR